MPVCQYLKPFNIKYYYNQFMINNITTGLHIFVECVFVGWRLLVKHVVLVKIYM